MSNWASEQTGQSAAPPLGRNAALSGRAYPAQDVPQREPEILRQLTQQKAAIHNLHDTINILGNRLEAILAPVPPVAVGKPENKPISTPLGNILAENTHEVFEATVRVQGLLSRLEI